MGPEQSAGTVYVTAENRLQYLLDSSKGDILLDSAFESREALAAYQTHPKHLAAAAVVKSVTVHRSCADIEI